MQGGESVVTQPPQLASKKSISDSDDYEKICTLGKGAYGLVSLARKGGKLYAIKAIEKKKLAKQGKQYQAFVQKQLLRKINHPGIIKLVKCYQDSKNLNYVVEYCHGGDFTTFIRLNIKHFTQQMRVFYVAEIVSILQYLHNAGITHRDLKPQNILLSKDGHLKLIDFGTAQITRCKILDQKFKTDIQNQKKVNAAKKSVIQQQITEDDQDQQDLSPRKRRSTFVGTCFYLSPQLLEFNVCEPPSDLWALGCIIYQLYYLQPPFKAAHEYQIFEKIKNVDISFPKNQSITEDALDLIKKLLVKIPQDRLGANEKQGLMFSDLKSHPYFKNINFQNLFTQKVPQLKQQQINPVQHEYKLDKIKKQIQSQHEQILADKDNIIYTGIIEKKTFASYTVVYYIVKKGFEIIKLTNHKPEPQKVTLTPIKDDIVAQKIQDNKFTIIADQSTLTVRTRDTDKWVEVLNTEYKANKV